MIAAELPRIGVLADKYDRGINKLSDPRTLVGNSTFEEAFGGSWSTDAHFICYYPNEAAAEIDGDGLFSWPKCNKPMLPHLRVHGGDLLTTCFVLDYDNPGHVAWTPELFQDRLAKIELLAETWPTIWDWTLFYTTKRGCRFVYVLDEPIPVDVAEGKHKWLISQFIKNDILVDDLPGWNHQFRLPKVKRDGMPTELDPFFLFMEQPNNRLKTEGMPSLKSSTQELMGEIAQFDEPKPSHQEVQDVLQSLNTEGRYVQTKFHKEAKRRLKGKSCYDVIMDREVLGKPGERDTNIQKYVGQAIGYIHGINGTEALHVYALFEQAAACLDPDNDTTDWTDVLWKACGRLWAREDAKAAMRQQEAEAQAEEALSNMDKAVLGMKEWCYDPRLHGTDAEALKFLLRHCILQIGQSYIILTPQGTYDDMLLGATQVVGRIRTIGMDCMIETQVRTETGMRDVPLQTLLNEHGTVIMQTEAVPCREGSIVHDFDKSHSRVIMQSYSRNPDLPPAYNMQVDNWLKMMFGENYIKACEWIGHSLAFEDGPICALSIEGSSGVGKKMFITGLSECLSNPIFGTGDDIVGQYQYNLLSTPFIVVNEGWPKGSHGTHPADSFRSLVAGDTQMIQRKYLPPTKVTSPCRIIFTANNTEVVSMLAGNRDLSPDDREALAIRLLHLRVEDDAARWLRQKGGMRFTVGWIRGDGNVPSRYTVAQHFLWLYENRGEPTGSRFLVEGNSRDELIMFEMRTQSGSSPLVIEAIIAMLESSKHYNGMAVVDARLYCVPATVLNFYRENMSMTTKERMTANIVGKVFAGLRAAEPFTHAKILPGTKERLRWHELDCKLLLSVAHRDGWPCRKLEALVDQQLFEEQHALPKGTE